MWEKLKQLARRYDEIGELLEVPEIYADPKKLRALTREQKELSAVVEAYRAYLKCEDDIAQALELTGDPELKDIAQEELNAAKAEKERLFDELRVLLLPRDPNDDKNVIVEIRGGVGGARFSVSCEISACDINFFTFRIFTAHIQMIYQKRFIFKFFKFVYHILPSKNCTP